MIARVFHGATLNPGRKNRIELSRMAKKDTKTLRGVSSETFEAFVKKAASKEYEQAVKSDINVKDIISDILENNSNSSPTVGVSLFKSFVARELDTLGSELVKGVLVGMRDRYQRNYPAQLCVLHNTENADPHGFEVSTWDTRLLYKGVREQLPEPCDIELSVKRNEEYNNLEAASVENYSEIDDDTLRDFLKARAVNPSEITENDKYLVFVFKGVIDKIQPVSRFEDGEVTGVYRVVETNGLTDPVAHPVLQIKMLKSMSSDGKVSVMSTVVFDRCRNTVPNIMIDDVIDLCNEAAKRYSEPRSQAEWVENGLKGREIIVVGIVTSYKFVRDNKYGETVFLNIGGVCLMDYEKPFEMTEVVPAAASRKKGEPAKPAETAEPAEKKTRGKRKETKPDSEEEAAPEKAPSQVEVIADKILDYCATLKISPDELSLGEAIEKIAPDAKGTIVSASLNHARKLANPDTKM